MGFRRAPSPEAGCDFPGPGPHSFPRANIAWRQQVGGSGIEASKIAGHSLPRRIQERLATVGEKQIGIGR